MKQEWVVEVRDATGKAMPTAEVLLFPTASLKDPPFPYPSVAATHSHTSNGRYTEKKPLTVSNGAWALVVRHPGKSPVVQPISMTTLTSGEARAEFPDGILLTVSPSTERLRAAGSPVLVRTVFRVELHDAAEYVYLSGTDYEKGKTEFANFAKGRRDELTQAGVIGVGSLVTLISCGQGRLEVFARGRGAKRWVAVYSHDRRKGANPTPPGGTPSAVSDFSITDLYRYLDQTARRAPHAVKEVAIFSHSWPGGPILFNTMDATGLPIGARDTKDFDGRAKDFMSSNASGWPTLAEALAPDARWLVLGCRATLHLNRTALAAFAERRRGSARTKFFTVESRLTSHGHRDRTTERMTLEIAHWIFDTTFREDYLAAAAAYLDVDVWGSPPGLGASFVRKGVLELMRVDASPEMHAYFSREFGSSYVKNADGYVNYRRLIAAPRSVRPAFSSEYFKLYETITPSPATTIRFWNYKKLTILEDGFTHRYSRITDSVAPGVSGILHTLEKGSANDVAVYVQDDGTVRRILKDTATSRFTIPGPVL